MLRFTSLGNSRTMGKILHYMYVLNNSTSKPGGICSAPIDAKPAKYVSWVSVDVSDFSAQIIGVPEKEPRDPPASCLVNVCKYKPVL